MLIRQSYLDVMLAMASMSRGQLASYLMSAPINSPVNFNNLFEDARVCVPQLWGPAYPVEELLDDVQNYRPLKFLGECQELKLVTWEVGVLARRGYVEPQRIESLWTKIQHLEEVGLTFSTDKTLDR